MKLTQHLNVVHMSTFQHKWWMSLSSCVSISGEIWDAFTGFPAGEDEDNLNCFLEALKKTSKGF